MARSASGTTGLARARMTVIPDFQATTLLAFIKENIVPGSTIYTDGLKQFTGLEEAGYQHVARMQPLRVDLRKGDIESPPAIDMLQGNHGRPPHQRTVVGTVGGWSGKPDAAPAHATNGGLLNQADKQEATYNQWPQYAREDSNL